MTTLPWASSSWTRKGRTSTMRALVWASLVTIPDCDPVKLTAGTPRALRAMESSAMEMRSPAESSMSSSRRDGLSQTCLARERRSSVVSPMAETTTTTSLPAALVAAMRSATFCIFCTSATDEPPYFWTTMGKGPPLSAILARPYGAVGAGQDSDRDCFRVAPFLLSSKLGTRPPGRRPERPPRRTRERRGARRGTHGHARPIPTRPPTRSARACSNISTAAS